MRGELMRGYWVMQRSARCLASGGVLVLFFLDINTFLAVVVVVVFSRSECVEWEGEIKNIYHLWVCEFLR